LQILRYRSPYKLISGCAKEIRTTTYMALSRYPKYYIGDVQPLEDSHYVKDGKAIRDSEFAIGPAIGREGDTNDDVHGPFSISKIDRSASNQSRPIAGPIANRDWFDADRSILDIEKGPCTSSFVSPSHIR
jgi:hypothetical protein